MEHILLCIGSLLVFLIIVLLLRVRKYSQDLSTCERQISQASNAFKATMEIILKQQSLINTSGIKEHVITKAFMAFSTPIPIKIMQHMLQRKYAEKIDENIQYLQLKYPQSEVLDYPERIQLANDIVRKFAKKALKVGKGEDKWLEMYCMEAAKEISLVFNRSELLDISFDDVTRAVNRVNDDLSRMRLNKMKAGNALAINAAIADTQNHRTFFHVAGVLYSTMVGSPLAVAYHMGILLFPFTRVKNAIKVYIAAKVALYIYDDEWKRENGKLDKTP